MHYEKFKPTTTPDRVLSELQNSTNLQLNAEQAKYSKKDSDREAYVSSAKSLANTGIAARDSYERQKQSNYELEASELALNRTAEANKIANDNSLSIEDRQNKQRDIYLQAEKDAQRNLEEAKKAPWWTSPEGRMRKQEFILAQQKNAQDARILYDSNLAKLEQDKQTTLLSQLPDTISSQQNFADARKAKRQAQDDIHKSTDLTPAQRVSMLKTLEDTEYSTFQNVRLKEGDALEAKMDMTALNYYNREIKVLEKDAEREEPNANVNQYILALQTRRDAYLNKLRSAAAKQTTEVHTDVLNVPLEKAIEDMHASESYKNATPEMKLTMDNGMYSEYKDADKDFAGTMIKRNTNFQNNRKDLALTIQAANRSDSAFSNEEQAVFNSQMGAHLDKDKMFDQFKHIQGLFQGDKSLAGKEMQKMYKDGSVAAMAQAYVSEEYDLANKWAVVVVEKNKKGGVLPESLNKSSNAVDTNTFYSDKGYGQFLAMTDPIAFEKHANSVKDFAKYYGLSSKQTIEQIIPKNKGYTFKKEMTLSFDNTKANNASVEKYVQNAINNPTDLIDSKAAPGVYLDFRGPLDNQNVKAFNIDDNWIGVFVDDPISKKRNTIKYISKNKMYTDLAKKKSEGSYVPLGIVNLKR